MTCVQIEEMLVSVVDSHSVSTAAHQPGFLRYGAHSLPILLSELDVLVMRKKQSTVSSRLGTSVCVEMCMKHYESRDA